MLHKVKLDKAIGMTIGHDITKVVPGKFKGPVFRRGHIIKEEDIAELLSIGKEHIWVIELEENEVHEEEAAIRIARAIAGAGVEWAQPKEGRVNLKASCSGLLKVNAALVKAINSLGDIVLATRHNNDVCRAGEMLAGTKIIPLYTTEQKLLQLENLCRMSGEAVEIKPIPARKAGIVITGNEVYRGIIQDKFLESMKVKFEALGSKIDHSIIVPDDAEKISGAVREMKTKGCDVIVVCGGLSVDPDDVTLEGVRRSGANIISYGAPVMPGAMFLYAMLDNVSVLGAPAAACYNPTTVFDLVLPRVLAGEQITREDISAYGYGGLCLNCQVCSFPVCPFGR